MSPPIDHHRARPLRAAWQLVVPLLWVLTAFALVAGAVAAVLAWLLRSEEGSAWLLARIPGVQVVGLRGALLSPRWELDKLTIEIGGGLKTVVIEDAVADGLEWVWRPEPGQWLGLRTREVQARRVHLVTGKGKKAGAPASLASPLQVQLPQLLVQELQLDGWAPVRDLIARGVVGARGGTEHRIEQLAADWDRLSVQARGRIATAPPFVLEVQGDLQPEATPEDWQAHVSAQGPLTAFATKATLRGHERKNRPAPAFDLDATITPFAPWPLATLKASTQSLDLSSLSSALPATRLSGSADVQTRALDAPVTATVQLNNQQPGRWDQHALPLRKLELALRGELRQRDRLEIGNFDIHWGSGGQDAGRWRGSGTWQGDALRLQSRLDEVRPQHIDARATPARLSGPLNIAIDGLPIPFAAAASQPKAGAKPWTAQLQGELEGRLDAAPVPTRLQLDAQLSATRILVRQLRAAAGSAVAQLSGEAERGAAGTWLVKSQGQLADFDPLLWWPGAEGSAWRQGPHRFSADWRVDLQLPPDAQKLPPVRLAQTLAGSGTLRVHDAVLAGVPLQADVELGQRGGTAAPSSLRGELRIGGNRIAINGVGDPLGSGTQDRLRAEVKADTLASLAPIARLVPDLAAWAPRDGKLEAGFSADGRWPDMRSEGQARFDQVKLGDFAIEQGQLTWRFDTGAEQPIDGQLSLRKARWGAQQLDMLAMELRGTLQQHVATLDARLPLRPPAWTETLLGLRSGAGTRAQLRTDGAWIADGSGGGSWRGRIDELLLGATEDNGAASARGSNWLEARDLKAELHVSPSGGVTTVRAEAGTARLARELQLRWDAFSLDNRGPRADWELRMRIEPFLAAPMLARLQPTLGWGGDLRLAARVDIRAAERFAADITFERAAGDLSIDDVAGRQALGLQSLQLALQAQDGRWTFTQTLAGRILGEIKGQQTVRIGAGERWPGSRAALEGQVDARVGALGIWSAWVPPGWRLAGSLTTQARIGGRLGAPEYTGRVEGRGIAVRNLLLGVDVSDGELDITLQGERATIEKFSLRGGEGRVDLIGGAEFGASPVARLKLAAQRFRVLGRADRQLIASGEAALELRTELVKLDGALRVDQGLFDVSRRDAPSLDDDVVMRDAALRTDDEAPAEAPRTARRNLQVGVSVDLGDKLRVRGRGLDTLIAGQLRATTPAGRLAIHGLVRAEDGTYAAYGQKLEIDRGLLIFTGAPDNPGLDILALRPNLDVKAGVAISGNFHSPRVRLYSEPEMSETDKLSWLVLGRPSDGLGRADTALLQRAAVALLAGEGEAPTEAFLRTLGLDELSLRQSDGEVRETVITLGKQLSRRWYLGYERGVNATSGTWQLIYRIAQRFTLRAQSGHENSLDLIWVWRIGDGDKK